MQEHQPLATRHRRAGVHLTRASGRRVDPGDVGTRQTQRRERLVSGRCRHDHVGTGEVGGGQRAGQRVGVVVDRDDDGDGRQVEEPQLLSLRGFLQRRGKTEQQSKMGASRFRPLRHA
jgi:hypothetical protein